MKKYLSIAFLLVLTVPSIYAQKNSVLWEVSGNGLTQSSYLLGTLKFIGEKEYSLPQEALDKLKECKVFTIEDQVDHHAQHELNKALHYPKGETLATYLSAEEYKKVKDFFKSEFNIAAKQFDSKYAILKPVAISVSMTRLSLGEKVKFYDIELLKYAKQNKLTTFSLESIEREAQALNAFSINDQKIALLHSIEHFDKQKEEFKKLMADYPKGDLDEIFEFTLHPLENNPAFINEFYFRRNEEWLPKIEKMVKENKTFVAVGIAHLEGEKGLLNLLKAAGYTLTPVEIK